MVRFSTVCEVAIARGLVLMNETLKIFAHLNLPLICLPN